MHDRPPTPTRRDVLAWGGGAALAGALGRAAFADAPRGGGEDYRALVCVNLNGGVDGFSFALPRGDAEYAAYAEARQALAIERDALHAIEPRDWDGAPLGMSPELPRLAARFGEGDLAVVANVGPLVGPTSKAGYLDGSDPIPGFLFSHSDQSEQWRVARADLLGPHGWCGLLADRMVALNGGCALPTCISLAGETKLLVGRETTPYFLSTKGSEAIAALSDPRLAARFRRILDRDPAHPMARRYAEVAREAIEIDALLSEAFEGAPTFEDAFPRRSVLADQLRTAARVIAVRAKLGVKRQVFFVDEVGYDTHEAQDEYLPPLLDGVDRALDAFHGVMRSIGASELVTTFTTAEFGRTLSSNGKGTDHGWGNHHVVLGGAVRGRRVAGRLPDLRLGSDDDVDEGRILPTLAVEQYAGALARWFGLPEGELPDVFPNLPRFDGPVSGLFESA